ncbi:MAG: M48 family metalloprotease [Woeseia sp.]
MLATLLSLPVAAAEAPIDHKIPPGYEPGAGADELGIWMEVDNIEKGLRESALLVSDPHLNNYVIGLACRVAGDYCKDIRVYLIRNPGFNASMMPNGAMQVWTGMLTRTRSRDELAAVIGHEIGHYTRLHTLERHRKLKKSMSASSFVDLGIAVATGISLPVASVSAMLNALAFSREQESEADVLGARLLADAALDPHAAYSVWRGLMDEEAAAAVKRDEPGLFTRTHPDPAQRADELEQWVTERFGPRDRDMYPDHEHVEMLNRHYAFLMEDQIDTNRFGRTEEMLNRHLAMGVEPGLVRYYFGEMFRQRGGEGDAQRAINAYRHALESDAPPADAHRNLGYLLLKQDDLLQAQTHFQRYLELKPDASDRSMIEYYLEEEAG